MGSFIDSPLYQRMMAQALSAGVTHTRSPIGALGDVVGNLADAWATKKYGDKLDARDKAVGQTYSDAFAPQVDPTLLTSQIDSQIPGSPENQPTTSPTSQQSLAKLLSNPDVAQSIGPSMAGALVQSQARANEPITPYEKANLANQADQRAYERQQADFGQLDQGSADIQKAMNDSTTVRRTEGANAAAAMKSGAEAEAKFPYEKQLADARAAQQAALTGQFGRSMEGKSYNILAQGLKDPSVRSTPEYATAWQILSNPKLDPATGTIVVPDLSQFLPPMGAQQPGAAPGQPGAAPPQRMPNVQSFAPPNPSQAEAQSAGFANRLDAANQIFDDPKVAGAAQSYYSNAVSDHVPVVGNAMAGSDFQRFDQAQRNFINAQLRRESGAVISPGEFADARKQYLPQPGDNPDVLKQKKASRDMAVRNMQLSAGNTLLGPGQLQEAGPPRGVKPIPQTQGFGASDQSVPTATGPNGQKLYLRNGQWSPQ